MSESPPRTDLDTILRSGLRDGEDLGEPPELSADSKREALGFQIYPVIPSEADRAKGRTEGEDVLLAVHNYGGGTEPVYMKTAGKAFELTVVHGRGVVIISDPHRGVYTIPLGDEDFPNSGEPIVIGQGAASALLNTDPEGEPLVVRDNCPEFVEQDEGSATNETHPELVDFLRKMVLPMQ